MNKRTLMLSAAAAALLSGPAMAVGPTTISTVVTTPQKTSTTGDLTIASTGGITLKDGTTPLLTIDSNNTVNNGGTLSAVDVTGATAVKIDTTGGNLTGGFTSNGAINLSGLGDTKRALWLAGTGSYTGNIVFDSASGVTIVGDSSVGILTDSGTTLNGDLLLDGTFGVVASKTNEATSSSVILANLQGTINGNVVISGANAASGAPAATYTAIGNGAQGIVILGVINACTAVGCAEAGTFSNSGSLGVAGIATRSTTTINAESGSALIIANSIAGGVLNNGSSVAGDGVASANIIGNGVGAASTVLIQATTVEVKLGQLPTTDVNTGYSFVNRGSITASPEDPNNNATAIRVAGSSATVDVLFDGTGAGHGFFNSGVINAQATSSATLAGSSTSPGTAVSATALEIDSYVTIPDLVVSSQSVTGSTVGTVGIISASITGPMGGQATGIVIAGSPVGTPAATVTHVPQIDIQAGARVAAIANAPDPTASTVTNLVAVAIQDLSNSLATINNAGQISATATTLTNGHTSVAVAVDTHTNSTALSFTNNGAVTGEVLFGSGADTYLIQGTTQVTASHTGAINFGLSGAGTDTLHVAQFANVAGAITAQGTLDVKVDNNAILSVQNIVTSAATSLKAHDFDILGTAANPGTLNITVTQNTANVPIISASDEVTFNTGTQLGIQYGGFISSNTTINLISTTAGNLHIDPNDVAAYNAQVGGVNSTERPFLFKTASIQTVANDGSGHSLLQLTIVPKTVTELGLTGYGKALFTLANTAVLPDTALGAAMIAGINSQSEAQAAYDAFAPDVSGGARSIAISITDQATGVVAARQRALRLFGKQAGDLTLWGNEFGEYISTKGSNVSTADPLVLNSGAAPGFKDHGFGFSLGIDEGSASSGWYGAAFTFYTGDIAEGGDRTSKASSLWYLLTAYTDWRGKGLFLDSQLSVGYGNIKGKRFLDLTLPAVGTTPESVFSREADSKRAGLLGSLGVTLGAIMKFGASTVIPQISLDGMSLREEGFTETGGGMGFNLAVKPYYANSLRVFVGSEFRTDIDVGDFFLQPSARIGYRYDLMNDPAKLHAAFADIDPVSAGNQNGAAFVLQGPDPAQGNYVAGLNLAATTENWTIGLNYDFVRGSNNATEQVGTLSLLGRI